MLSFTALLLDQTTAFIPLPLMHHWLAPIAGHACGHSPSPTYTQAHSTDKEDHTSAATEAPTYAHRLLHTRRSNRSMDMVELSSAPLQKG